MCLLIHQPKGLTFSHAELRDFFDYNPDGFGFMYAQRGNLIHYKALPKSADQVIEDYHKYVAGRECVLHFRMATHGTKSPENAHPFEIVPGVMLAHNGVLAIGNPVHPHKTDTEHFIEFIIRPYVESKGYRALFDPNYLEMLGELIGPSNRFAIVAGTGELAIVNEHVGVRHKRAWMSNTYAWSAPGKVGPRVYRGTSTRWDGWDGDAAVPEEDPQGEEMADGILEMLAVAAQTRGSSLLETPEERIAEFCRRHPQDVAFAYMSFYELSGDVDQLADYIEKTPEGLVDAILDILRSAEYLPAVAPDADAA